MNINELLKGYSCDCGRHHTCDIDFVAVERGAMGHLAELTEQYERVLLVADENTWAAAGEKTQVALDGKMIVKVVFSGDTILIPDEKAITRVEEALGGVEMIVGIGSGVIQDLCKYVSFQNHIPYIIVATAPSMDGYASNGAAMILKGMKETVAAGLPRAILADTDVLCGAPMEMIRAGYGDIVGKYSALNDWKLSHAVTGEYFCQWIYDLVMECLQKTLLLADGLDNREEAAVQALMDALVAVGIAMSFAGSSRPASGSEHHLSHFFEITGIVRDEFYFCHGIDVAYATVITAKLRQELLQQPWTTYTYRQKIEDYEREMDRIYGSKVSMGCMALQEKMGRYKMDMAPVYCEREAEIRKILAEMPSDTEIEEMLAAVGLNMTEFYRVYPAEKISDAIRYGKDLKDRYSVLWMYYDLLGNSFA